MEIRAGKTTGQNRNKLVIVGETVQFLETAASSRQSSRPADPPGPRPAAAIPPRAASTADGDWEEPC